MFQGVWNKDEGVVAGVRRRGLVKQKIEDWYERGPGLVVVSASDYGYVDTFTNGT